MTQELLRLHDAVVRREGRITLAIDDFVISQGEQVVVLGPNGSGKSTLVNLLTREVMPLWREDPPVRFQGDAHALITTINETVGVVSTVMQDRMNVNRMALDIVLGGLFCSVGVPYHLTATEEQKTLARAALAELGVLDLADRAMPTLSTGQARRVLVARALINAPKVLVFDEPCAGLDPEASWHLRQAFSSLAQAGRTLLLVTHDVADIVPEFERVIMLQHAHIVADGPKKELLTTERLRQLFDVPVTLREENGHYHLH